LTPIVLIEIGWITRNYMVTKQFIPLQTRVTYNDGELFSKEIDIKWIVGDFSKSFGGDHTFWNPRGTTYWFFNNDSYTDNNPFPNQIFNDTLTLDKLKGIKTMCIQLNSNTLSPEKANKHKDFIIATFNQFHSNYKNNHSVHFYFFSRIIHLKKFIIHSGVYNIPFPAFKNQNIFQKLFKLFYAVLYFYVFVFGFISSAYLLIIKRSGNFMFLLIPMYIVFLFPFMLKVHEYRFNTLAYPFLLIGACYATVHLYKLLYDKFYKNV